MLLAVAALISLVATAWISARSTRVIAGSIAALDHTRDVLQKNNRVGATLAEAESGARAYALTGAPHLRRDFEKAAAAFQSSTAALASTVTAEDGQRSSIEALTPLVAPRLALLRQLIAQRDQGAPPAALSATVFEGDRVTRSIIGTTDEIRSTALRRFHQQTQTAESELHVARDAPWVMCSLAVTMLVVMFVSVVQAFRAELSSRDDLQRAIAQEHLARQRAEDADQMKDRFLATLSHELRSPLAAIIGWCGLLASAQSRDELLDEGLTNINEAAHRQSRLVEDLLDTTRIVAGKLTLCLEETEVGRVIETAVAAIAPAAQEKGVRIVKSFEVRPTLLADAGRLEQVISNLIGNAIKFTPAGKTIEVTLRSTRTHIQITVRDEGEGIAPELLPVIFDRFRQARQSGARQAGLGLGLSIVKNLVELHGGVVRAESEGVGRGTTFTVELPIGSPEARSGQQVSSPMSGPALVAQA